MGALEAARTAQRLSTAPVAIERRRAAHPAAPATRTSVLETVFACSRLSYIMRSSVIDQSPVFCDPNDTVIIGHFQLMGVSLLKLTIPARGFQCNVIHLMLFQPFTQSPQIRGERSERSRFFARLIPVADPDTGTHTFLAHVQTRTPTV